MCIAESVVGYDSVHCRFVVRLIVTVLFTDIVLLTLKTASSNQTSLVPFITTTEPV